MTEIIGAFSVLSVRPESTQVAALTISRGVPKRRSQGLAQESNG
jgi:hypothetical protein